MRPEFIYDCTKTISAICSSVSTFPIFSSFDLRGDLPDPDGKIWAGEERGGGGGSGGNSNVGGKRDHEDDGYRAQLHTKSQPTAVLSLLGVTEKDAGTYKCRVDFKRSPTRYWKVNLDVIGEDSNSGSEEGIGMRDTTKYYSVIAYLLQVNI